MLFHPVFIMYLLSQLFATHLGVALLSLFGLQRRAFKALHAGNCCPGCYGENCYVQVDYNDPKCTGQCNIRCSEGCVGERCDRVSGICRGDSFLFLAGMKL